MNPAKPTIFAVPSGSLNKKTLEILVRTWIIPDTKIFEERYEAKTNIPDLVLRLLDRRDMPRWVKSGMADFGLTGMDYLIESWLENKMEALCELKFSRASNRPTRLVLAWDPRFFSRPEDVQWKAVYTELPRLTRRKLREICGFPQWKIKVEQTYGKTETWWVFPEERQAFADIVETGNTLKKNGLIQLAELSQSFPTFFVPNWKCTRTMEEVIYLMTKTLEQEQNPKVMVKMNVPRSSLDTVKNLIGSETSPTIMATADENWLVLEVLVFRTELITKIGSLRAVWVVGIAETEVTSVF